MPVGKGSINRANGIKRKKAEQVGSTAGSSQNYLLSVDLCKLERAPEDWRAPESENVSLEELKKSIDKFGVLEAVIVRRISEDRFQLLSGYKRVQACRELGLKSIKAEIMENIDDKQACDILKQLMIGHEAAETNSVRKSSDAFATETVPVYLL